MLTDQTVRVLDRKQLDAAGPVAGGAQMMASTPGANVVGYGETGATKYTILLNGIQQGWAGEATSFTAPGSLGITYDGVPVADPATGLWQSATVPQNLLMQNLDVTYGPGARMAAGTPTSADEWNSLRFSPRRPCTPASPATYGQFNQRNLAFVMNTGNFHGWSTVVGGGVGDGDDYRVAPDGFANIHERRVSIRQDCQIVCRGQLRIWRLLRQGGRLPSNGNSDHGPGRPRAERLVFQPGDHRLL